MTSLATFRSAVRVRVQDTAVTPIYADSVYDSALTRGMGRINMDLGTSYTLSPATVPTQYDYLVELRGTIEMCYVRGAEGAATPEGSTPSMANPRRVQVKDLYMEAQEVRLRGPQYWLDLAKALSAEYNDLVERLGSGDDFGVDRTVQVGTMFRNSLRSGARTNYNRITPYTPNTLIAGLYGGAVQLSWEAVRNPYFRSHVIERSENDDFAEFEVVFQTSDTHRTQCDDNPGDGTWYYRIRNKYASGSSLDTLSDVVEVVLA